MKVGCGGHGSHSTAPRARRGELAGSMERKRYGLGKVEESAGVLTFEGIGSRWPGGGDRRGGSVLS